MANGTIAFDTLQTSGQISGTAKSLDTDYVVSGSAKSWVFTSDKTAYTVSDSLNISGTTDNAVGNPEFNFTNTFSSVNIAGAFDGGYNRVVGNETTYGGITSSSYATRLITTTSSVSDLASTASGMGGIFMGDLA